MFFHDKLFKTLPPFHLDYVTEYLSTEHINYT